MDDLDLRKLRYFVAVAERRHFRRAAEQLFIAQPVLSRQIRALEAELGCALLERTTRRVQLTAAGEQLLGHARVAVGRHDPDHTARGGEHEDQHGHTRPARHRPDLRPPGSEVYPGLPGTAGNGHG